MADEDNIAGSVDDKLAKSLVVERVKRIVGFEVHLKGHFALRLVDCGQDRPR